MQIILIFLLINFSITNGYDSKKLQTIETKIDTNTETLNRYSNILQEILNRLPKGNPYVQVLQEVAAGKISRQSSQYIHFIPGYANDGNLNTISHTRNDLSQYWEVDLGHDFKIRQVEIYEGKIAALDITAGPSHNQMTRCNFYTGPAKTGDHLVLECSPIINGRYVRIQKMNHASNLALAEVKVLAFVDRRVG
ncbi:unnamed protein product [Mytilus coruscus]|uniref:Fucolectin tachylectin-4 pentraxin-1 domain-containing protein n=1 Tax=Mytilus coruscus TaxID=42192 RepID=A0A6J8E6T2_MYTCO|nr:unnamed protein product [Mytilus coruscus]